MSYQNIQPINRIDSLFNRHRVDTILIYDHGMQYFYKVLNEIKDDKNFYILYTVKHKPKNVKNFIKEMHSFDCSPFEHLKARNKYLSKKYSDVYFIFIRNLNPDEYYLGGGDLRHRESLTLKHLKDKLRIKYNPYKNERGYYDHTLYATDSEEQSNYILFYLGYKDGVNTFNKSTVIDMPFFLQENNKFEIIELNTNEIYCNIHIGNYWDKPKLKTVKIKESPHYIGLTQDMNAYKDYISKYFAEHDSLYRYANLVKDFNYLSTPYETSFVIVGNNKDRFIVLDGLHRISIHIKQGHKRIKVCKLS